jgi:tetratricopeptide (TPR) repeat protein
MAQFARASPSPLDDDAALAALLAAHDQIRWDRPTSWARLLELARAPSAIRPDFAFGHSMLATADAYAVMWNAMPERRSELIADASREARRALELDPRDSAAWVALFLQEPTEHLLQREAILLKGIARDGRPAPPYAALFEFEGWTLRDVGRPKAAVAFFERAQAIDPLSPPKNNSLMLAYAETGDEVHAQVLLGQSLRRWPNHPDLRLYRLIVTGVYGSPVVAVALLDDPAARPVELPGPAIAAWRAFLRARVAPAETAQAVKLIVDADDHTPLGHEIAVAMLAVLGRGDLAWVQADKAARQGRLDPGVLFVAKARAVRQDPRFPSLVARMGVADYWRETGRWPDVCQGPQPEPECLALRAMAQSPKA